MKTTEKNSKDATAKSSNSGLSGAAERQFEPFGSRVSKGDIFDRSHQKKRPEPAGGHFLFTLFFLLAAAAALWQHAEAGFTVVLLGMIPLVSLIVYVPYRWIDTLSRQLLNIFLFFAACFWCAYATKQGVPYDLTLIEFLCACSFVFLAGGRNRDHFYLLFISFFLLIYAALIPRRVLLELYGIEAFLALVILFGSRSTFLAGGEVYGKTGKNEKTFRRTWHLHVLFLLIAIPVFIYTFSLMPLHDSTADGYFTVSFITKRSSALPQDMKKWFNPGKKKKNSPDGRTVKKGDKTAASSGDGRQKSTEGNSPKTEEGSGNGGGSPGKELLFTVSSPLKLYHLAALYDEYDGKSWKASKAMQKVRLAQNITMDERKVFHVTQKYTIHKWVSRKLCAAFQPESYLIDNVEYYLLERTFYPKLRVF